MTESSTPSKTGVPSVATIASRIESHMGPIYPHNAEWRVREIELLVVILDAFFWLQEADGTSLDFDSVLSNLNLRAVFELADASIHPRMPVSIYQALHAYLNGLPDYDPELKMRQRQNVLDHHGMNEMHLIRAIHDAGPEVFKSD